MAKKAILDVLESTIGKYVKNLDSESLNVALWNGQIELNSLELNIGAVNAELDRQAAEAPNLALPFRISSGRFDSLQIDVPWSRISSRSVVFRAKGLNIVLEPCHRKSGDPLQSSLSEAKRLAKMREERFHSIKVYDEYRRQANAIKNLAIDDGDAQSADQASFSARLVRRIIENLQVEIEDVHIVFRNHMCSAGVKLLSLSLVTTDESGNRTFVDRTIGRQDSFLCKMLQINGFALYLDEKKTSFISEDSQSLNSHAYILQPLSFQAKLRQSDSVQCIEFPKYLLRSQLSNLSIVLLRSQLEQLHKISKSLSANNVAKPIFPEYRPLTRISSTSAKAWWCYAFACVRRLKGNHLWVDFFVAFQKRKEYLPLYKRFAHSSSSPWMSSLSTSEKRRFDEIESDETIAIDGLMTWRSIADAQVDLERSKHCDREKNAPKGYMSSFFGKRGTVTTMDSDAPPITLTAEEMKELEAATLEHAEDLELSYESWLCDITFQLGSFQVDLRNANRPLATLQMGAINATFNANADGSLKFDYALSSLDVRDLVTPGTLFPMVLRNLASAESKSLELKYAKSRMGDQDVRLSMVAFELVASPLLVVETKSFFSLEGDVLSTRNPQNPILRESLSGSVDLFFDAESGRSPILESHEEGPSTFSDQLSNALTEAWKAKTEKKSLWTVNCDIQAPVLIFPENCCHYESTVLVFDFGHLDIEYGNMQCATTQVLEWARGQKQGEDASLDVGNVSVDNLGFSVGKAKEILTSSGTISVKDYLHKTKPVVEPVSATFSCGILAIPMETAAQFCFFGSFPSLSLRASSMLVSDSIAVMHVWSKLATKLGFDYDQQGSGMLVLDNEDEISDEILWRSPPDTNVHVEIPGALNYWERVKVHIMIQLDRLSLYLDRECGDGVQAHLVSASATFRQRMDGAIQSRLCMGWFWILDMLESSTFRRQRLVAHSTLPRNAEDLALCGEYKIFDDIAQLVESTAENSASGLADITFFSPGEMVDLRVDPFISSEPFDEKEHPGSFLEATFASLYVHWNPRAIITLTSTLQEITDSVNAKFRQEVVISPRNPVSQLGRRHPSRRSLTPETAGRTGPFLLKATMAKFEVMLNSARDDSPLYRLTMKNTSVGMLSLQGELRVNLELGDLQVAAPLSSARESYHAIVGLSSSVSSSLLTARYYDGKRAVHSRTGDGDPSDDLQTYAEVFLSPMTCVYLQAQVLTLVDYINDGILGALAAQAASTAANVALEIAASGKQGNKIFSVTASGFDLIVPESALSHRSFLLHTGTMCVAYTAFPHPGGGTAVMSLGGVRLSDESLVSVVDDPLQIDINVKLPPVGIGTLDDQAMRVDIHISKASFLLSKEHYVQLMKTLECNVGEENTFLRPADAHDSSVKNDSVSVERDDGGERPHAASSKQVMTHAGVAFVNRQTRIYVEMTLDAMSLEMFKVGRSESLILIEAVRMAAGMDLIPDQQQITMRTTLHNVFCQDRREESSGHHFTRLFDRTSIDTSEKEVFKVIYIKDRNTRRTAIELTIGAPKILLIPDAVSDLADFVFIPTGTKPLVVSSSNQQVGDHHIEVLDGIESIETMYLQGTHTFSFSMAASSCQLVLVDLGSSNTSVSDGRAIAESIVVQGDFEFIYSQETEVDSGVERKTDIDVHGEDLQAYSAYGFEHTRPLQILEPTAFSLFYNYVNPEGRSGEIEIRAVTLSDVELTVSMQNIALLEVIASGLAESVERRDASLKSQESRNPLSDMEVQRISELVAELESVKQSTTSEFDESVSRSVSMIEDASSHSLRTSVHDLSPLNWKVRCTLPKVVITIVNDLQGLDEALFRVGSSNVVLGGEVHKGMHLSKMETLFDAHVHCTLTADYFDSSINAWQQLLSKPWEVMINTSRSVSKRYRTNRLSTLLDVECFPCFLSFSEQFLASLKGANRMWSTYRKAIDCAVQQSLHRSDQKRKILAASATRKLITSLPYGVENVTGMNIAYSVDGDDKMESRRHCAPGFIKYFRFDPPRGDGIGGRRLYGQEITHPKRLKLFIEGHIISIDHMDVEIGLPRKVHKFDDGTIVITHLRKDAKSMILRVGSQVDFMNLTMIPFQVSVCCRESKRDIGICDGRSQRRSPLSFIGDDVIEKASSFGLPVDLLRLFEDTSVKPQITLSPSLPKNDSPNELVGDIVVPSFKEILALAESGTTELVVDTVCSASRNQSNAVCLPDPFVVLVRLKVLVVDDNHVFVDISLEPRATVRNCMPVLLLVKSPMPHTFTTTSFEGWHEGYESVHMLAPLDFIEVFTPGPSLAISIKCADHPVSGGTSDWMKGTWIDLPMVREFRLHEPIKCEFPFIDTPDIGLAKKDSSGMPFFVVENRDDLTEGSFEQFDTPIPSIEQGHPRPGPLEATDSIETNMLEAMRSYLLTVCNYGVDHTGKILFEQVSWADNAATSLRSSTFRQGSKSSTMTFSTPMSAFASTKRNSRVTLLPSSRAFLTVLSATMQGDNGFQRSQVFRIEDISICGGGIESSPLKWEDGSTTCLYMYRTLVDSYQSEIHVIPEFVVYNASRCHRVVIRQIGAEVLVEPRTFAQISPHPKLGLVFTLDYLDFEGRAGPLRVDELKHQVAMVKSIDGYPLGSIPVQTVIGGRDSRLVVKLGEVKFGESFHDMSPRRSLFDRDLVRSRVRWSELHVTLCETKLGHHSKVTLPFLTAVVDRIHQSHPILSETATKAPICTIRFSQFTVDWQRIFKDEDAKQKLSMKKPVSPERSQLSVVIRNIRILDNTPGTSHPIVFDSSSPRISFCDLCIRTRGPLDADLVKIDVVDLNLAHNGGVSDSITVKTSEDFVWKLLDIAHRIVRETTAISHIDIGLEWDDAIGDYRVVVSEGRWAEDHNAYAAPPSDRLFDVTKALVSPFCFVVSFQRRPQASRYKLVRDVGSAKLLNYFTTRLKFTLEKAELKFARYEGHNIKGPPSRLFEIISAIYVARMKLKVVSILSAANFQDWKFLAARDGGDDEYVDGDILRATGNLVGNSADFLVKKVGHGLGGGLSSMTKTIGSTIENASDKVGARALGAGVNSVVTGLGEGIGGTVIGVGTGAGKVLKGTGKGVGQVVGGVTGGFMIAGKGIGKGVSSGDGKAVLAGFTEGAVSIGNGVGQGVESAVMGAADGVLSVGQGLFSGVKSIGRGIGGAFKPSSKKTSGL